MTQITRGSGVLNRGRRRALQYRIRTLIGVVVFVAAIMATVLFVWPRRTLTTVLIVSTHNVQLYEPHLEELAEANTAIRRLEIDRRTNSVIVSAQARDMEQVRKYLWEFLRDPSAVSAAASLDITLQEAKDLIAGT